MDSRDAHPAERRRRRDSGYLASDQEVGFVDLHSLRTTYVTWLVKGGANARRRSSWLDTVPRHDLGHLHPAGNHRCGRRPRALPVVRSEPVEAVAQANGTDGKPIKRQQEAPSHCPSHWRAKQRENGGAGATTKATPIASGGKKRGLENAHKTRVNATSRDLTH
jgi:hypothetical protein